jgi:hypothetical protein
MDCDQVFMILTRGPFPSGDPWDDEVECHLETCADCWRLAEALRPAVEVFQEAVPPAEGRGLPGYRGDARPLAVVQAPRTTARLALADDSGHLSQPYYGNALPPLSAGFPVDLFRAALLASTLTATAVGLVLLWHVW